MEVVGGVASIITLIEATGILAEVSKNLVLRWRNAPHEIQALATRLSLLAAELQSIKNATARSHPILTDAFIRQSLSDLLTDVRKRLTKLESLHFHLEQHGPMRQKIRWTVKDAGSVEKMLSKTQEVEQRLANLMTLISLRAQTPILDGLNRIEQMVSALVITLPASVPMAPAQSSTPTASTISSAALRSEPKAGPKRTLATVPWTTGKSWENWGLRGALVMNKSDHHSDYSINFSISLPLARILGSYALTGSLSLRSVPLRFSAFTFRHPSYFAVARIVDMDHPFMVACERGDMETMRSMLRSGEGRPTDATARGHTPMLCALLSRNTEVIAELLDHGVEVDAIANFEDMSTPLENACLWKDLGTVRFLLQRGASADHVNSGSFGASALCWGESDLSSEYSSEDIFNLIAVDNCPDLIDSKWAIMALYLASSHGCGSQIHALLRLHPDKIPVEFPIKYAASNGNYSTFSALLFYVGEFISNNMLGLALLRDTIRGHADHLARSQNESDPFRERPREYDEIIGNLLRRGISPQSWVQEDDVWWDYAPHVPREGMRADELAAACGPVTESWYLGMVRLHSVLNAQEEDEISQRLRELSRAGHVVSGLVYGGEEQHDGPGDDDGSGSEGWSENLDVVKKDRAEDIDDEINATHKGGTDSEIDENGQFWDALEQFY